MHADAQDKLKMALEMQRVQLKLKTDEAAKTQELLEQIRHKDAELIKLQGELRSARSLSVRHVCIRICAHARPTFPALGCNRPARI